MGKMFMMENLIYLNGSRNEEEKKELGLAITLKHIF